MKSFSIISSNLFNILNYKLFKTSKFDDYEKYQGKSS